MQNQAIAVCTSVSLRGHNSGTKGVIAVETLKGIDKSLSCNEKQFFLVLGFRFFVSDVISSTFRPLWPISSGPGPKLLGSSISLKFLLETRLKSESFDTLDDLPGFQVQKL